MEKKNILVCLERLDIGGVETAVLNQVSRLLELGHKVVVLAKRGIYTEILEQRGAICKEFEFGLDDNFNTIKTQEIVQLIKEYQIQEAYIHQFPCILSAFPACLITNVPYIAYVHNGVEGVYEWFMTTFPVYETAIPYYYLYAHKIIAITENVKQDIINRFSIQEGKILVIHNSISFQEADRIRQSMENKCEKFLLVSRFSKEKGKSIYNAIDLYSEYAKENEDATLKIIGDGELRKDLEAYVKDRQIAEKVTFLGAVNNVLEYMNEAEIVLGVDRCILEAIVMKKIAIIAGYEETKQLITKENIEQASEANFSGHNLDSQNIEELIKQIQQLTPSKIDDITEANYEYAKEHLNVKSNVYTINQLEYIETTSSQGLFEMLVKVQQKELKASKINKENRELEKELEKTKLKKEELIQEKQERIEALEKELSEVYNSKRWKYIDKILKIFH